MTSPINLLKEWIEVEKKNGAEYAQHAVLSTKGLTGYPHARVVAIREINEERILFFTQKNTRKVNEIEFCQQVSLTFWLELSAREVIVEGKANLITAEENEHYWQQYPKMSQVRFCAYAPTSSLPIDSKEVLEHKRLAIEKQYKDIEIPLSPDYCGIAIIPERFLFYSFRLDELSDVWEFCYNNKKFEKRILSP